MARKSHKNLTHFYVFTLFHFDTNKKFRLVERERKRELSFLSASVSVRSFPYGFLSTDICTVICRVPPPLPASPRPVISHLVHFIIAPAKLCCCYATWVGPTRDWGGRGKSSSHRVRSSKFVTVKRVHKVSQLIVQCCRTSYYYCVCHMVASAGNQYEIYEATKNMYLATPHPAIRPEACTPTTQGQVQRTAHSALCDKLKL